MIIVSDSDIKEIRDYINRIIGYCEHVPIGPIKENAMKIISILDYIDDAEYQLNCHSTECMMEKNENSNG